MSGDKKKAPDDIAARAQALARRVMNTPPKSRLRADAASPTPFQSSLEELISLMNKPGTPRHYIDGALELFNVLGKCLFVKIHKRGTLDASNGADMLQPTDLFLHYVAAFRAGDWPKVAVIQHDILAS